VTPIAESIPPGAVSSLGAGLQVQGVGVSFSGVIALRDVSMGVRRGEVLGLIGPNGAGKTTLFDVVSGLQPPASGSIFFDGNDITGHSAVARSRAGMRRTFQRQQVFGRLTVEENLLTATEWHGGGGGILADLVAFPTRKRIERRRREAVNDVLQMCGLESFRHAMAGSLPIGTARMVELGRALAESPSLLLLDEPTSGLGGAEAEHLSEVIRRLKGELSCAILLVEHDITFVMSHCDRVVVLQLGEVLAEGTPSQIQANPEVRDAYLG
jgi:branched-chain amino acid transport system ATP-binding protein